MKSHLSSLLESHAPALGTWISIGSPIITEMAARFGFDWLLLDLEHGCFTEAEILQNLQAIHNPATSPVVRVPSIEASLIARVLDRGAQGIMAPHIASVAEAEALVAATRYAPRGGRGYSRTVRTYGYGLDVPADPDTRHLVVMAQIENLTGVEKAGEIAAVDGVDVLFVGPADLTHDLTTKGQADLYEDCLVKVSTAARESGKIAGILARNPSDLPKLAALGYRVIAIDSDLGILRKGYQETIGYRRSL